MNYRKSLIIILLLLVPFMVVAKSENAKGFCDRISEVYSSVSQRLDNLSGNLEQKRSQISTRLEERRQNRDNRFEEKRNKWDLNREEHFAQLEEKAQTDEQKQALLEFKQAVSQAIIDRREAIDQAIRDFRTGVEDLKLSRWQSVDELINSYRNEIKLTYEKAESDCNNGVDQNTIRQNLRNQLRNGKNGFVSNKQSVDNIREDMQELIEAKKQAISKAVEDFKATIAQALSDLKEAFPEIEEGEE